MTSDQNTLTRDGEPLLQDDFTPEQNFQYALRLLRITQAWSMVSANQPHSARNDPLFPGNRLDSYGNRGNAAPYYRAVSNFLRRFEVKS